MHIWGHDPSTGAKEKKDQAQGNLGRGTPRKFDIRAYAMGIHGLGPVLYGFIMFCMALPGRMEKPRHFNYVKKYVRVL